MPPATLSKDEILSRLMLLFRQSGYDGASLADIAKVTGFGKSSMYHHFPGGKADMAIAVLRHLQDQLRVAFATLEDERSPEKKLDSVLRVVDTFYDAGRLACLLERLCASVDREVFAGPLRTSFVTFIDAFESIAHQAGLSGADAKSRAEAAVVEIQGALVVSVGANDPGVFTRALQRIRAQLLAPPARTAATRRVKPRSPKRTSRTA
jgi:TetR/AcrR family transcriptional regulator, lmrAB and yxaGH operons repressor